MNYGSFQSGPKNAGRASNEAEIPYPVQYLQTNPAPRPTFHESIYQQGPPPYNSRYKTGRTKEYKE